MSWDTYRESGKFKAINLQQKMGEFCLDTHDSEDIIKSLDKKYNKNASDASHNLDQQQKKAASRFRNHVKDSTNFHFAEIFKNLSDTAISKISLFLSLKDLSIFMTTCKIVKERVDSHHCWFVRSMRDFLNLRIHKDCFENTNASQLYRFLHYIETKSEIRYATKADIRYTERRYDYRAGKQRVYTKSMMNQTLTLDAEIAIKQTYWWDTPKLPRESFASSDELSKTLIDSISTKTPLLNYYVFQMIPEYYNYSARDFKGTSWQPNLNISWLERRSGVQLWLGGVIDERLTTKNLRSIRLFGDEVGQKAYVLDGKYLIIESTLGQQEEDSSVTIVDLEEALKDHCMGTAQFSWRYCFHKEILLKANIEPTNKVEKQDCEQGSTIEVEIPEEDVTQTKIQQIISTEGLRVFYTQNTNCPSLFIFDPKEKGSYTKISLNLSSSLHHVFLAKKFNQKEEFTAYLIDESLNIYMLKYSQEKNLLKIRKGHLKKETNEKSEFESAKQGVVKSKKEFHHEIHKSSGIEYLILFKSQAFYLVNLDTLQFSSRPLNYNKYEVAHDWTFFNDKLYLLENEKLFTLNLDFSKPSIEKPRSEYQPAEAYLETFMKDYMDKLKPESEKYRPGMASWKHERDARRWICMNSCYTIFIQAMPYCVDEKSVVDAHVFSTQKYFVSKDKTLRESFLHNFNIKLENFIGHLRYEERANEIAQNMNVKLEDNTLVVQTSTRSFAINLEAYRKSTPTRFVGKTLTLNMKTNYHVIDMSEEEKEEKERLSKKALVPLKEKPQHVAALNSVQENWNHGHYSGKKKIKWSQYDKKENKK